MVMKRVNKALGFRLLLSLVIIIGMFFRLYKVNWDENQHLHPDERFLTMVMMEMKVPPLDYLDQSLSTVNPKNLGFNFYVYGTFPLLLTKYLAVMTGFDHYNGLTLLGRVVSALVDGGTLILVFILARSWGRHRQLGDGFWLWATLFYALAVLPIQLSHFFATDTFLSFFMFGAYGGLYLLNRKPHYLWLVFSGVMWGLGMASKVSALYILPLLLSLIFIAGMRLRSWSVFKRLLASGGMIGIFLLSTYMTLRLADPYLFESPKMIDPRISKAFTNSLATLKAWEGPEVWFPPAVQWIPTTSVWFSLKNMAQYGLGLPLFSLVVLGAVVLIARILRQPKKYLGELFTLSWIIVFFVYQSSQFVKALRYFMFLYPFMALLAGIGAIWLIEGLVKIGKERLRLPITLTIILFVLVWPLMFLSIYIKPHTRIAASEWIYEQLPVGSVVINEHWDDPLPLILPNTRKRFTGEQLPVFDQDTPQKWQRMEEMLNQADYYFLTSNRAWGSITKVPEKYPQMARFYEQLLAQQGDFVKVAEFTSYPSLAYLGIPIRLNDDDADETFTVYDHPKVMIFERKR
jgi:hypothetical protein